MTKVRIVDGDLANIGLGAIAALIGVVIAATTFGLVMGLFNGGEETLLASVGFGALAGLGLSPVTIPAGAIAAHFMHHRDMSTRLLAVFAAIGAASTIVLGMLFSMDALGIIALAAAFGGLGALISARLYDALRQQTAWTTLLQRLEPLSSTLTS